MQKTYYEILNVTLDATEREIKIAYSNKIKIHSPEKDPKQFNELRKSYEELINVEKRSIYDYKIGLVNKKEKKYKIAEKCLLNSLKLVPRIDYSLLLDLIQIAYINENEILIRESKETLIRVIESENFNYINYKLVDIIIEEIESDRMIKALQITKLAIELIKIVGDKELESRYKSMEKTLKENIYTTVILSNEKYRKKGITSKQLYGEKDDKFQRRARKISRKNKKE